MRYRRSRHLSREIPILQAVHSRERLISLFPGSSSLRAAYNDSQQLTAAFDFNMLRRINRELDVVFDVQATHHAFYHERLARVEMHLLSKVVQS
jgi:uncharacterized SAM-dependent methyltransferase